MAKEVLHAIDIKGIASNSLIGILLGTVLALIPASTLVGWIAILIGVILIVVNGFRIYQKISHQEKSSNQLLLDVIGVLSGFILLSSTSLVITIIVAIYLIIEPILELWLVKFDREKINIEVPKIILGVIVLLSGISVFDKVFKVLGIVLLVGSLIYLGFNYYLYKRSGVKIIK